MKEKRRNYTQEFKDEAVKLIRQQDYFYAERLAEFWESIPIYNIYLKFFLSR